MAIAGKYGQIFLKGKQSFAQNIFEYDRFIMCFISDLALNCHFTFYLCDIWKLVSTFHIWNGLQCDLK